jgi:hypothetical protein
MENLQPQGDAGADPPSAGARYRAHLAQFPERTCETRPPRWCRDLLRLLRALAWWSARRRRYEGR